MTREPTSEAGLMGIRAIYRGLQRALLGSVVLFCIQSALGEITSAILSSNQKKALVIGRGPLPTELVGSVSHPQVAAHNFLVAVGNLENDPAKGWTCDFSWDLMVRLGMNPTNTPLETLFNYIGKNHLGYRIAINNGPSGMTVGYWGCAVDNGMMPFAPQGNNNTGFRFDDGIGLRAAVGVAGGYNANLTSVGPGVEFFDHAFPVDHAQSWANQVVAAKFAKVLDAHPNYNIWDAREHLRQAGSFWASGWTETNGYGCVDEKAMVGKLFPAPPVDFNIIKSRNRRQVTFTWRNFRQSNFAAAVIARKDGRILYQGSGTNFVWNSDLDGAETFVYWSVNHAGEKSRIENYQKRRVTGLNCRLNQTCLVLGAPTGQESVEWRILEQFQRIATNWVCDLIYRPGNAYYDKAAAFPVGPVVAILADFPAMVSYAISNQYRILVIPITPSDGNLYAWKREWDRAIAAGIIVVLPHSAALAPARRPRGRKLSPAHLYSAITVGTGFTNNILSYGPGLEFFDAPSTQAVSSGILEPSEAAATVAGKLALILDAYPKYNIWDARQHLRQSSSYYISGWIEDGGYGRPANQPARISKLDVAPPIGVQATKSADGTAVTFSWENFLQSGWKETIIKGKKDEIIYHGTGTNFLWRCDSDGEEIFTFCSKDNAGRLSKREAYTVLHLEGLKRK